MSSKKGVLICGFSGIGKTTLGQKYENVAEIGQSLYKNIYLDQEAYEMDREHRKNIETGILPNPEWPMNYVKKITELLESHDIVLVFTDFELMDTFRKLEIPFVIALPDKSRKEEFLVNFKNRGQDEAFCRKAKEMWEEALEKLMEMKEQKIILHPGEYLEDVLLEMGYLSVQNRL